MQTGDMIEKLKIDLGNEWRHLMFYLYSASSVAGLHREEYREYLLKAAAGEQEHVVQFQDVIIGLGGWPSAQNLFEPYPSLTDVRKILEFALSLEEQVVKNYTERLQDAEKLAEADPVNSAWLTIFLEDQLKDSRQDADNLKQILRGM